MLIGKIEEKLLEDLIPKEELRVALKTLESKKELLKELDHRVYVALWYWDACDVMGSLQL